MWREAFSSARTISCVLSFVCSYIHAPMCLLRNVCLHVPAHSSPCSHMRLLRCLLTNVRSRICDQCFDVCVCVVFFVWSPMCGFRRLLTYVCSYVCAPLCVHSCVWSHLFLLVPVSSYVCSYVSTHICLGDLICAR